METHTPNPAEPFTILREELRLRLVTRGESAMVVLIADMFMRLLAFLASRPARAPRQPACRDDAGAQPERPEPERIGAPAGFAAPAADAGPDRQAAPGRPDAEPRPAAAAAVAAAPDTPAIDRTTPEDCLRDEPGPRTACARPPREPRHSAGIVRSVAVPDYGNPVLQARFAKMALRTWVEPCQFRYGLATNSGRYRGAAATTPRAPSVQVMVTVWSGWASASLIS